MITTQIKTISTQSAVDFTKQVNDLLELGEGWELFGTPTITTVSKKDTWDGETYSTSVTTYVQVLKRLWHVDPIKH